MDRCVALIAAAAIYQRRTAVRQRRERLYWVHPIRQSRTTLGEYHRLVLELRLHAGLFQGYFRLSVEAFDDLLARVGPLITKITVAREPICAAERLSICLR